MTWLCDWPAVRVHATHGAKADMFLRLPTLFRSVSLVTCSGALLAGCATLPSSGPTARQVVRRAASDEAGLNFAVVNLDPATMNTLNAGATASDDPARHLASLAEEARPDVVGPGDVLSVSLYEVGISLFAGRGRDAGGGFDPSAHGEQFPQVTVDANGEIQLPYVGRLPVGGRTTREIALQINQELAAKSQAPQAVVTIAKNVSNAVIVSGDIKRPARVELSGARERLLDAIAIGGGSAFPADDTLVRFGRRGRTVEQRLGTIRTGSADDLVLVPGDRIELIRSPRSFTVFGATARVSQVAFESSAVSMAEAIARVGGPSDAQADPTAVFLFRYEDGVVAADGRPVIYRLNMLEPASYFLAQRFAMKDKDVLYIANSASNQPVKVVGIINQLFAPFVTVRAATR